MAFFNKWLTDNIFSQLSQGLFNKYGLAIVAFIVWISFFDGHNLIEQQKLKSTINILKQEKAQYDDKISEVKIELNDIESNKEKYAREKYFMHKENEEVFIILK